jgi:hypothetical protein
MLALISRPVESRRYNMKHLTWRKGVLYAMLAAIAFNSLACSNALQTDHTDQTAKYKLPNEQINAQRPKKATKFDETMKDIGQFAGGAVEVTLAVALGILELAAENPCLWHCLLCHHH